MLKNTLALSFLMLAAAAQAQSTPAKKELAARILKLQQPGIESMARSLVEQPAVDLMGKAGPVLAARVAKDKQEAVSKEIQADIRKYLDDAVPLVQGRAVKLAPTTIGTLLEEKYTEDELKQIVSIIESPVYTKFQRMGDEMQKALVEKLMAETRPLVDPKVKALEQTVAKRLGVTAGSQAPGAGGAAQGPAPAKPPAR